MAFGNRLNPGCNCCSSATPYVCLGCTLNNSLPITYSIVTSGLGSGNITITGTMSFIGGTVGWASPTTFYGTLGGTTYFYKVQGFCSNQSSINFTGSGTSICNLEGSLPVRSISCSPFSNSWTNAGAGAFCTITNIRSGVFSQ